MSDCLNPNCKEKDLHPVTVRSYDGCCSPLCEEIVDHERTCDILEGVQRELAVAKNEVVRLVSIIKSAGLHDKAPCCICGYNGAGYYQPSIHKCFGRC
jgi:hypothetical protein